MSKSKTQKRLRTKSRGDEINEQLMAKRHCRRVVDLPFSMFITQEQFNDVMRYGSPQDVLDCKRRYPEMMTGIDRDGFCPLMCIADRKFSNTREVEEMLDFLTRSGAKMHSGCFFSTTPLYYAATKSPRILQAFVKYEQDWDTYVDNAVTPWRVALYTSEANFEIMLPFIPAKAAQHRNYLGQSLLVEVIQQWPSLTLKMVTYPHFRALIDVPDDNGETPLAHSAKLTYNRADASRALIDCGADVIYKKDDKTFYYADTLNQRGNAPRSVRAVDYIRHRICHGFDHSPFEVRYTTWYK